MLERSNSARNASHPERRASYEFDARAVLARLGQRQDSSVDPRTFHTLDAMRAIAATAIVVLHSRLLFNAELAPSAYLAVDLFFVLSGFVLAHVYDGRRLTVRQFMTIRAIRLYPLYALGLLFAVIQAAALLMLGQSRETGTELIISAALNAVFLPSPLPSTYGGYFSDLFPLNGASWSLFFEILINIAFCTAIFKRGYVLVAVVIGSALLLGFSAITQGNLDTGWQWDRFLDGVAKVGFSFTVGVLLRRADFSPPALLKRIGPWPLLIVAAGALVAPIPAAGRAIYDIVFVVLISPALVWAGAHVEPRSRFVGFFRPSEVPPTASMPCICR